MQANGGLVQHVANALQVTAQLRGQAYALRLATRQRGRTPIQREITQAHLFQKLQTAFNFGHQVAGDVGVTAGELQLVNPVPHIGDR